MKQYVMKAFLVAIFKKESNSAVEASKLNVDMSCQDLI